jgi:hypothetical protein
MRCLSPESKARVKPEAGREFARIRRRPLFPRAGLKGDNTAIAADRQVVGTGKLRNEEEVLLGRNVPELKGQSRPPKLDTICFPQWNLGGGPVRHFHATPLLPNQNGDGCRFDKDQRGSGIA